MLLEVVEVDVTLIVSFLFNSWLWNEITEVTSVLLYSYCMNIHHIFFNGYVRRRFVDLSSMLPEVKENNRSKIKSRVSVG